jgi:hypothetical protein
MVWAGIALVIVGFALVTPRGSLPGSAAVRNVRMAPLRLYTTPGYQGDESRRARWIRLAVGLVFLVGGIALIGFA